LTKTGDFLPPLANLVPIKMHCFDPNGIALDTQHDLLFVSDSYFGTIKVFKNGESFGELTDNHGVAISLNPHVVSFSK
jgi:sugar lactone lactonase YvrE